MTREERENFDKMLNEPTRAEVKATAQASLERNRARAAEARRRAAARAEGRDP